MKAKLRNWINDNKILYRIFSPIIKLRNKFINSPIKKFNDLFSNVIEGSIIAEVKNIPGIFKIDARSHILRRILIEKTYEPIIADSIKKNTIKNKDAINVGANIGIYTNLLANIINPDRKVLAIEPTPNAYKYLLSNIERNSNQEKVITFQGVVSDMAGNYNLKLINGKEEYSSLGELSHSSIKNMDYMEITVKGETIDNLVERYNLEPGILVIDVEGAEFQVLTGAIKTLQKFKPIIISELVDELLEKLGNNSKGVIKLLENNGYVIENIENVLLKFPFSGNIIAINKN